MTCTGRRYVGGVVAARGGLCCGPDDTEGVDGLYLQ